jgi:ABC-type multidrug transport system permease subunit
MSRVLESAWQEYLAGINDPESRRDALEEQARELKQLQQLLIGVGDRRHGVDLYRKRMRIEIKVDKLYHRWKQALLKQLYHWTCLSGSSAIRPLLIALTLNAGLLPLLYWSTGAAYAGTSGTAPASFVDTLILSLANVVSLSTSRAQIVAQWASALQALQALSGYVILAFVLWVALRFSDV